MNHLEERVAALETRNKRVELDKAWETSVARRVLVAVVTYGLIALYLWFIGVSEIWVNAIVPTVGFLLSTLTLGWCKQWWIAGKAKRNES